MGRFRISEGTIQTDASRQAMAASGAGAVASFEGLVRDHNVGRRVAGLSYQAYVELAEAEGNQILGQAIERFEIIDAACIHRIGKLSLGEVAVWVGTSAAHRGPAFDACRWILDEVKARVPIWKHEQYADGEAEWLHPVTGATAGRETGN